MPRLQKLEAEARKLLEANEISITLKYDISGIDPPEDQLPVARALCERHVSKRVLHAALGGPVKGAYRRKIIALCKEKVFSED